MPTVNVRTFVLPATDRVMVIRVPADGVPVLSVRLPVSATLFVTFACDGPASRSTLPTNETATTCEAVDAAVVELPA